VKLPESRSVSAPAVDRARPLAELAAEMSGTIDRLREVCDYVTMGQLLPPLIDELYLHAAQPADEAARRLALETLVDACICASMAAKALRYLDLACLAATRAEEAAALLDDPVQKGKADFQWLMTMPRAGSWDRTLTAAERAACSLEPKVGDGVGLQVLGQVTLVAALAAASVQRADAAADWLGEAEAIARRVPDEPALNWMAFSATNVGIWRVAIGVERGEGGGAMLDLAAKVNLTRLERRSTRRAALFVDVGRGLARDPKMRAEAVQWLRQAEETAPQKIRNSSAARETVAFLLSRATATAGGRELRGMAARMGVPH
jgi:hypothetical protein